MGNENSKDKAPGTCDSLMQQGNTKYHEGKKEEAIHYYDEAIKLDPSYQFGYTMKCGVLEELGKVPEAIECYNELLKLDTVSTTLELHQKRMEYIMKLKNAPKVNQEAQ